jgi:hypothetical protein
MKIIHICARLRLSFSYFHKKEKKNSDVLVALAYVLKAEFEIDHNIG